jgi:aspartate 1-decarboxylase
MVIPFRRTQENIMQVTLLKSKLHRVTTTHAELDYEGSCAIDGHLLDIAGIREYEQIQIYNITNGERFTTYAIRAEDNSGIISVNGAAAHKAKPQDLLIIATFASMNEAEADVFKPKLVYFDGENRITHTCNTIPVQMKEAS